MRNGQIVSVTDLFSFGWHYEETFNALRHRALLGFFFSFFFGWDVIIFFFNFYSNGINMHRCQYNTVQSFNDYKREAKRTCID